MFKTTVTYVDRLYRGRIDRKNYLLGLFFYIIVTIFLLRIVLIPFFVWGAGNYNSTFGNAIADVMILIYLVAAFHIIPLFVRRCHDIGCSILFLFFLVVPICNILLFIMFVVSKSERQTNRYGKQISKNVKFIDVLFNSTGR